MKDILTSDDAIIAWLMAAMCRQIVLIIVSIMLLSYIFVAAIEAYRCPKVLLDRSYQSKLFKQFLNLLLLLYLVLFTVFAQPLLTSLFEKRFGFKSSPKDLEKYEKPPDKNNINSYKQTKETLKHLSSDKTALYHQYIIQCLLSVGVLYVLLVVLMCISALLAAMYCQRRRRSIKIKSQSKITRGVQKWRNLKEKDIEK